MPQPLTTHAKALDLNLDPGRYGSFAEIGAGQEVGRWFFRVGGAAGTIAKTMSAYDKNVSDAIYGTSARYVSSGRLQAMLDYEYDLLIERLDAGRGVRSAFFAFADTVRAQNYGGRGLPWLDGYPLSGPCEIRAEPDHPPHPNARSRCAHAARSPRHPRCESGLRCGEAF